jgi:ADP-ribose pyrophosphatase
MENPYRLVSRREIYRNPWIRVREDIVRKPSGAEGVFGIITLKPGSSVLPIDSDGHVYLAREFKYGVQRASIEVISGGIDPGETPLEAARRELREEAGLVASHWEELACVDPFTTVVESPNYLFAARGLSQAAHQRDDGEIIELLRVPFEKAVDMVMDGEITHAGSCILILKVWRGIARR